MSKILIVDDEPSIRRMMEKVLADAGYTVLQATDGRAALAMILDSRPDLVITDIFMKEGDGIELMREITGNHSTIPVIAMSAPDGKLWKQESLKMAKMLGAAAELAKPFTARELLEAVAGILVYR